MGRVWACMAVMVMVVGLGGDGQGYTIRPSLLRLAYAKEIQEQLDLIELLLGNLINRTDCSDANETKEEDATGDDTEMISESEETTETPEEKEKKEEKEEEEEEEEDEDKCDYKKINKNHIMLLPPNENCKVTSTGITDKEKELILSMHNDLRAKVARGNETRGDPGPQPPAANMHELTWNEELAKVAQAWASQCPTGHDKERERRLCTRKFRTGQNINYYWGVTDEGPRWQKAIENWYNEVKDVDAKTAASFIPHKTKKIGHYTQFIWGASKEIGCGIVYYETERKGYNYTNSITNVCNYGPAGNVLNRPFYEHGLAASNCPGNVSMAYLGLCV